LKEVKQSQISAFRLARHHFLDKQPADVVTVSRNICGVQAQLMASAQMALWARTKNIKPQDIESALYKKRALVKTYLMRQTLHLIPSDEFSLYINAIKTCRAEAVFRIMLKFGITRKEVESMNNALMEILNEGPLSKIELTNRIKPMVGKNIREWMGKVWGTFRPAIVEGLICYGVDQGQKVTFVRTDQWLSKQKQISEIEAQQALFRRFLGAYGPATVQDFAKWSGLPMPDAKRAKDAIGDELIELQVEGKKVWLLRCDYEHLVENSPGEQVLRLIPGFDPYMLAHVSKDHLVSRAEYKRIYRNQGWISNVILLAGRVIGIWTYKRTGSRLVIGIEPFEKITKSLRKRIEQEANGLAEFFGASCELNKNY
jgi:uncharacterized protein YcaQ